MTPLISKWYWDDHWGSNMFPMISLLWVMNCRYCFPGIYLWFPYHVSIINQLSPFRFPRSLSCLYYFTMISPMSFLSFSPANSLWFPHYFHIMSLLVPYHFPGFPRLFHYYNFNVLQFPDYVPVNSPPFPYHVHISSL